MTPATGPGRGRLILGAAAVVVIAALAANPGARALWRHARDVRILESRRAELLNERGQLQAELHRLQSDPVHLRMLIRRELGYVEPGEMLYRFAPTTRTALPR